SAMFGSVTVPGTPVPDTCGRSPALRPSTSTSTHPAPTVRGDNCESRHSAAALLSCRGLGLTAYFLLLLNLPVRRSRGVIMVGDLLPFQRRRPQRSYGRPGRWRVPRISTLRLLVLWGVLVALYL